MTRCPRPLRSATPATAGRRRESPAAPAAIAMTDQRNLILAVAISIAIVLGFQYFYEVPRVQQLADQQAAQQALEPAPVPGAEAPLPSDVPAPPGTPVTSVTPTAVAAASRDAALSATARVAIESPRLHGSITLTGGRIDDLTLADYRETTDPESPEITLLSPAGATRAYYAEFGWVPAESGTAVPVAATEWRADRGTLAPGEPVTLSWDNGAGLRFTRRIALDDNYMFTVTQAVKNSGVAPVTLYPYGLISRSETPETLGFYILHEGLLGVFDGTLLEIDYDDLQEDGKQNVSSTGGWIGITDKYWLMALLPDQSDPFNGRFFHTLRDGTDKYQVDFQRGAVVVPAGGTAEVTDRLFAGAKEVQLINEYDEKFEIVRFDLVIDWGWYPFLTKPIFIALDYFNRWLGNFGLAILLLTIIIKALFFPLANKSYKAMSKMKKLQPKMTELRERYGDDKARMQKEIMLLYKAEKVNPMSGCLPIVVQIPVFFALYKVLFVTIEMRHAPFFGWIKDLSAPDPTSLINLFGLLPFDSPEFLAIGVWPLIMGLTMLLQQRLNPQPADPMQAKIMMALPIVFTFIFARVPAGLVIYWVWNNVLSIAQQWIIMRKMGVPA